uniref:N-acetyltransferase domain-containing protein n=1 Tax=viral metagenome TaxID=1070528 RepID=A0A6C0IFC5_9ZZZZ
MTTKFITNNEEIKNGLLEMGIKEFSISSNSSQENRQHIRRHIEVTQENFCRHVKNNEDIGLDLLDNLMDEKKTSIFFHAGYKIPGLLNFNIITVDNSKIIVIHNICVPQGEEKGTGRKLIDCVKALATKLGIQKIAVLPIETSKNFYIKQGFIEEDGLNGYLIYELKGGKRKSRKSIKSRKYRKSRKYKHK